MALENQAMKEQTEKVKSSEPFPRHSITWVFPILAIAYFDASLAMLCCMFLVPFIVLVIFLISKIAKRFSCEKQLRYFLSILAVSLTSVILYWGVYYFSPEKMFESAVASPVPESVKIIEKSGQLSVFGSSSFYIVFNISNTDFDFVLGAKEFTKKNLANIDGRKPELYRKALNEAKKWLDDVAEL